MVNLQITLQVSATNRLAAMEVYLQYKAAFLNTITGAISKELLVRTEDVQVLHQFDSQENARAYLQSELFCVDVVGELRPLIDAAPDIRIYQAI